MWGVFLYLLDVDVVISVVACIGLNQFFFSFLSNKARLFTEKNAKQWSIGVMKTTASDTSVKAAGEDIDAIRKDRGWRRVCHKMRYYPHELRI
jgi:hypothetical protein